MEYESTPTVWNDSGDLDTIQSTPTVWNDSGDYLAPLQVIQSTPMVWNDSGDYLANLLCWMFLRYSSTGGGLAPVHGRNLLFQIRKNTSIEVKWGFSIFLVTGLPRPMQ